MRGVTGGRNLETAAWPLATVAMLADGHAPNLAYQGFGHSANLRVVQRHSSQRAAIATDDYRTVPFLEFGEATQLVEHLNRRLEPCVRTIRLRGMLFGSEGNEFRAERATVALCRSGAIWHMPSGTEKLSKIRQMADVGGPTRC